MKTVTYLAVLFAFLHIDVVRASGAFTVTECFGAAPSYDSGAHLNSMVRALTLKDLSSSKLRAEAQPWSPAQGVSGGAPHNCPSLPYSAPPVGAPSKTLPLPRFVVPSDISREPSVPTDFSKVRVGRTSPPPPYSVVPVEVPNKIPPLPRSAAPARAPGKAPPLSYGSPLYKCPDTRPDNLRAILPPPYNSFHLPFSREMARKNA